MKMAEDGTAKDRKRSRDNHVTDRNSKKTCMESDYRQNMNGSNVHKTKKIPRLSPALFHNDCEIQHRQIHKLLKYACLGKDHNVSQPSWCHVHHQKRLHGVVVIILQDLSQLHFYTFYLHFRYLRRLFKHRFSLPSPPTDFIASLVGIDQSGIANRKTKIIDDHHKNTEGPVHQPGVIDAPTKNDFLLNPIIQKYGNKKNGLTRYLLSPKELKKNDYPLVGCPSTAHFVESGCTGEVTDSSPLFGLDCEMCLTDEGYELTRISLVNAAGQCIMDELVKPDNVIRNYVTRYSGITEKLLLPVKTKLKDVQYKLKTFLPPDAVLVGHSLNNDLKALQMIHTNVIDTALLFIGEFKRKFRLKFLAQAVLGREIQREDVIGHNPCEDAKAALDLARYFILHGPKKVAQLSLDDIFRNVNNTSGSFKAQENKPVLHQNGVTYPLNTDIKQTEHLAENNRLVPSSRVTGPMIIYLTRMNNLEKRDHSKQLEYIPCTSDKEVLQEACKLAPVSPISVIEFCPKDIYSNCTANDMIAKVKCKFEEMMTVFAGPFKKDICLKSVKRAFQTCGPILSISILSETYQPFVCIKFSVLEAARLALEGFNETYVDGCFIKIQEEFSIPPKEIFSYLRIKGFISKCNLLYKGEDLEQLKKLYSMRNTKDIKSILLPRNRSNRKHARYCYLKFQSFPSALLAAEHIRAQTNLRTCKAVTASHLHRWLKSSINSVPPKQPLNEAVLPQEHDLRDLTAAIRSVDRKINQLYECLERNTMCLILFPGKNSADGLLPGFGLMGIKEASG
ncbi:RNA exonuclease 5-like [Spea bombifrons]|uniref:RNA exonuclease 5-like n=1 Tax=Spea bombifrons TaxID=233779 RepID=UPI00234A4FF2|nr:RNA exonuclease 5-like [Spea bombifrons]